MRVCIRMTCLYAGLFCTIIGLFWHFCADTRMYTYDLYVRRCIRMHAHLCPSEWVRACVSQIGTSLGRGGEVMMELWMRTMEWRNPNCSLDPISSSRGTRASRGERRSQLISSSVRVRHARMQSFSRRASNVKWKIDFYSKLNDKTVSEHFFKKIKSKNGDKTGKINQTPYETSWSLFSLSLSRARARKTLLILFTRRARDKRLERRTM